MKNVHLLPTDKSSRLVQRRITKEVKISSLNNPQLWNNINIYIASDEKPKKDDWVLYTNPNLGRTFIVKCRDVDSTYFDYYRETLDWRQIPVIWAKKIVLTTDQDLINDGVQGIEDEFLEWFAKNPTCEFVEVEEKKCTGQCWKFIESDYEETCLSGCERIEYEILIPQEELKQTIT
jgi:hypothetical protein